MNKKHQLIIILSGKKQAGKTSAGRLIFSNYANNKIGEKRFSVNKRGDLVDKFNNNEVIPIDIPLESNVLSLYDAYKIKLYSFADPLKEFVHKTFGIELSLLYGSDSDKNTKTHILWDDMPPSIRTKYSKPKRGSQEHQPAFGHMTVREVLQVFGTDICRNMDPNCWSRSLYNKIKDEKYDVAVIMDARFPNEVTMGTEIGAKSIRLTRHLEEQDGHISEMALDDFPLGEFSCIVDNHQMTFDEKNSRIRNITNEWIRDFGISK